MPVMSVFECVCEKEGERERLCDHAIPYGTRVLRDYYHITLEPLEGVLEGVLG